LDGVVGAVLPVVRARGAAGGAVGAGRGEVEGGEDRVVRLRERLLREGGRGGEDEREEEEAAGHEENAGTCAKKIARGEWQRSATSAAASSPATSAASRQAGIRWRSTGAPSPRSLRRPRGVDRKLHRRGTTGRVMFGYPRTRLPHAPLRPPTRRTDRRKGAARA